MKVNKWTKIQRNGPKYKEGIYRESIETKLN